MLLKDLIREVSGHNAFAFSMADRDHPGRRGYGIEIEYDRMQEIMDVNSALRGSRPHIHPKMLSGCPRWVVGSDGSLERGCELFTSLRPYPPSFYEAMGMLEELAPLHKKYKESWRAATQVHVDVGDYNIADLGDMLLKYARYEYQFFAMAGAGRTESNFCVPIWMVTDTLMGMLDAIHSVIRNPYDEDMRYNLFDRLQKWPKYMAINLLPLVSQGTVEFRHLLTPAGDGSVALMQAYLSVCSNLVGERFNQSLSTWSTDDRLSAHVSSILNYNTNLDVLLRPWQKESSLKDEDKQAWDRMTNRLSINYVTTEQS